MAIPFFSIDLTKKDYFRIIMDILFPFNKKKVENEFKIQLSKKYPGKYISLMPSARLGFYLTLKFLFKKNDLILFSNKSFPLYIKIAKQLKLRVKLVDVSEVDLNINVENLLNLDDDCKGLVITHLFGYPCNMDIITNICKEKKIKLIEDCAQSFGSKYKKKETGNFGDVGIISTSLLKIPTTLSGGILITHNKSLYQNIEEWLEKELSENLVEKFKLFFKIIIFILNSYPKIYSIISDKMFFFLKNYQPRVYRKILYSGMGLRTNKFNPKERPKLSKFQLTIGLSQIKRNDEMEKKRRENSQYLQSKIAHLKNIKIINNHFDQDWNHQYFVINVNKNFEKIYEKIFKEGIHVMDENVWDCSKYNFQIENKNKIFEISRKYEGLLRIQNNSKLNFKSIDNIANVIISASNEV